MELTLTKLPWYAQVGAFVALAVAACGLFFYYYEMPVRADMTGRKTQLMSLKGDIATGVTTAKKLPEFRSQVSDLEGRLANLKAILPEEKDAADLLNRMQTVAAQSNMTITATCVATTFVLLDKPSAPAKPGAKPAAPTKGD